MDLAGLVGRLDEQLTDADADLEQLYPGPAAGRQPVHTVYVPADSYTAGLVTRYGTAAHQVVAQHRSLFLGLIGGDETLLGRVLAKLEHEPVEDLRIDFEAGYGDRGDDAEDAAVVAAATALREDLDAGVAPPSFGIRFKSLERPTRERGVRTLVLFLEGIARDDALPPGFVVTLPKVTSVAQVEAMARICQEVELEMGLAERSLVFELQVETPQAIVGPDGTALVAPMIHAAEGRCTGLHYGTYDYSASIGISAAHQSLDHPAADYAKAVMQAAAAGTGVRLSDGSTNILPVGDEFDVRRGWETHLRLVRRSLERGFYQGWDLHPHQLPTRYAATFAFFRDGLDDAVTRLSAWRAQESGAVADEPATVKALAGFVGRGVDCGAFTSGEVTDTTGYDIDALARLARPATY